MPSAHFRFYEELNDFLPPSKSKVSFEYAFVGHPAIKDIIEAIGVPHTEVDLILVDGESVDFSYPLVDGARVSVYPMFEALDITPLSRVRRTPLRTSRFVLDAHLGGLARYLRLLGFDTWYRNDYDDAELAHICESTPRILLTRDRGLLKRSAVTHGYYVRETQPLRQTREVLRRFDLYRAARPFHRCLHCNGLIKEVSKEKILDRLEPKTRRHFDQFWRCENCQRIYWRGGHYKRMRRLVQALIGDSASERCSTTAAVASRFSPKFKLQTRSSFHRRVSAPKRKTINLYVPTEYDELVRGTRMGKGSMHKSIVFLLIASLAGCATSGYQRFYEVHENAKKDTGLQYLQPGETPTIQYSNDLNQDALALMAKGFLPIGRSVVGGKRTNSSTGSASWRHYCPR